MTAAHLHVTDCAGEIILAFENRSFTPSDPHWIAQATKLPLDPLFDQGWGYAGEDWWVEFAEGSEAESFDDWTGHSVVRVSGMLESGMMYGHFGLWRRQIVVHTMTVIGRLNG